MSDITMILAGYEIPLRPQTAQSGNTWWGYAEPGKNARPTGARIPALADELPTEVTLLGVTITLEDVLVQQFKNRDTGRMETKAFPYGTKRSGSAEVEVNGAPKKAKVTVTVTKAGDWNLTASVNGQGASARPKTLAEVGFRKVA